MPTHYVEDFDGKRAKDGDPARPESVAAAAIEDWSNAKVVSSSKVEDKAVKKSASTAKRKR